MEKNTLTLTRLALLLGLATQVTPTLPMLKVATLAQRLVAQQLAPALGTRDMHINDYKGVDTVVKEEYQPAIMAGPVWAETDYLKNLYQWGPPGGLKTLTQGFFNLQGPQFRPTRNAARSEYALTPELVGQLAGLALAKEPIAKDDSDALAKAIVVNHKQTTGEKITETKTKGFMGTVQAAKDEISNGKVLPLALHGTFGAVAHRKFTKAEFLKYLLAINSKVPIFKDPQFATNKQAQDKFVRERFNTIETVHHLQELRKLDVTEKPNYCYANFLPITHALLAKNSSGDAPPQVIQSAHSFKGQQPSADCTETALRDFFNCLVYNKETKTFDIARLRTASAQLKEFYSGERTQTETINNATTGQAWMDIVSGHPDMLYRYNKQPGLNYELEPSINNLIKLTNRLAGTTATNLAELGQQLSTPERTVTITAQQDEKKYDETNTVTVAIDNGDESTTMNFEFQARAHAEFSINGRNSNDSNELILEAKELYHSDSMRVQKAAALFPLVKPLLAPVFAIDSTTAAQNLHTELSQDMQNPNERLKITRNLIRRYTPADKDHLDLLTQSLPEDGHFKVSIAQDLLQFWHPEHAQRLDSVIRETPEQYKDSIVSKFIRNWRPEHAQRLDSVIRETPEQYKDSIASEFIRDWRPEHAQRLDSIIREVPKENSHLIAIAIIKHWRPEHTQRLDSIIREAPEQYKASIASEFIRDWRPEHAQRLDSIIREVPKENSHLIAIAIIKHWRPEHTQRLDSAINEVPKEDTKVGVYLASEIIEHWRPEHAQHLDSILNEVPKEDTKVGVYLARVILVHWRPEHAPHLDFLISKFDTPHPDFLISEWDEHMRKENKKYMTLNIIDLWNSDHAVRFKNIIETLPIDSLEKIYTHTRICNNGAIAIIQEVLKKKSFTSRIKIFFGF